MKTEKNILIAFLLNITFSIFDFLGGLFTNSVAILSDSIHDLGNAISIGISYFMERKSKKHVTIRSAILNSKNIYIITTRKYIFRKAIYEE